MPGWGGGTRRSRGWWWLALALGLLLRLWFLRHPMPSDDDTDAYAELAQNLFHHGVYGFRMVGPAGSAIQPAIDPSLIRLPGYPLFLGLMFSMFGAGNLSAVLLTQIAIDLLACWLIAQFVREQVSERAGRIAIFLAALCPFTASYSAIALTECLSVFAVSLGLWATGRVLRAQKDGRRDRAAVSMAAAAMALAMLLRPDGVLLAVAMVSAMVWYGWRQRRLGAGIKNAALCAVLAALPLVPWTVRNWTTFHVVQPLAPRRVNNPGEYVTYGFYRWMSTWAVDVVSTGDVFWRMGSGPIDVADLPARAFDSPRQRAETAELLAEYNVTKTIPPELDARFAELARARVRAHPLQCLAWVPVLRVADMWLRPRTETLGLDADWWRFDRHRAESVEAVGLGLLNLALVGTALVGVVRLWRRKEGVPWIALPVVYVVLRCMLLATMENSEPRYTLEAFPFVLACAACAFDRVPPADGLPVR
jgi:4-amino-4-deoxy-L-arabinose transferase-like glycosyltransferase